MAWKKLSSKEVYKNKWMKVTEDLVETDFGEQLTFGVVKKDPFALIIPWDGKYLILVGQYRYPVDDFSWEFPAGHFSHNSIEKTAREELKEEAGLEAATIKHVYSLYLAPGHHTQICEIFLATNLRDGKQELEVAETGMKTKKVKPEEFSKMIKENKIKDGPTLAAFGIIKELNLLK